MRVAWLIVTCLLLAGCTEPTEAPPPLPVAEPEDEPADAEVENATIVGVTELDFSFEDCDIAALVELVEPNHVRKFLPAGFTYRDAAGLVNTDDQGETGKAALIHAWAGCDDSSLGISAYFIDHPGHADVPSAERTFFILRAWTDFVPMMEWLATSKLPIASDANVQIDVEPDDPTPVDLPDNPDPHVRLAEARVTGNASAILEFTAGGATGYRWHQEIFRFFFFDGDSYMDIRADKNGTGGAATCTYGPEAEYPTFSGNDVCGGQGTLGMSVSDTELTFGTRWL